MDALTLTTACILCTVQPATAPNIARWEPLIAEASDRFAIPEAWIEGVMRAESAGLTSLNGKPITSSAGAMGLMQIMPDTYAALRKRYGFGADPYDPHDNILAGVAYLKAMYVRYGYPLLFAAYLTGPTHLDNYLSRPESLPSGVIDYVNDIAPGAISRQNPDQKSTKSKAQTGVNPHTERLFFASKSLAKQERAKPNSESNSIFFATDRPANLFVSLSIRNR